MAAADYFLKIDQVEGESTTKGHEKEIRIQSFSWGATQSGTFGPDTPGGGAGTASLQDFHFVMPVSKASPALFLACAKGTHAANAILTCLKAGEAVDFMKVTMSPVLVSSFQTGGSAGGDVVPTDQISLNFGKIEIVYKEQDTKGAGGGTVDKWFDVTTGEGG